MSQILPCPWCQEVTSHLGLGNLNHEGKVRNLHRCQSCKGVWEQVTSRKKVRPNDPILKMLV